MTEKRESVCWVPLSPIQSFFFDSRLSNICYFNQSLLLDVVPTVSLRLLQIAFEVIVRHHDALRMRYTFRDGKYFQYRSDNCEIKVEERKIAVKNLEKGCSEAQASLNIFCGPLIRVVLYRCDDGQDRLLVVVHHLIIDGVSWRILLDDLETICTGLVKSKRVVLPAGTCSYKQWSEALIKCSESSTALNELKYWNQIETESELDFFTTNVPSTSGDFVLIELTKDETKSLLYDVPRWYATHINDVLLTALTLAFGDIVGCYQLSITLEGHGREEVIGLDVTRTIGWFTSVFPIHLKLTNFHDLSACINEVKNILQKIPHKGICYGILKCYTDLLQKPLPKISFNYLGQWICNEGLFRYSEKSSGCEIDPKNKSGNIIDIFGGIKHQKLSMAFHFDRDVCDYQKVKLFAEQFKKRLLQITKR